MILIHLLSADKEQLLDIAQLLQQEKLATDFSLHPPVLRFEMGSNNSNHEFKLHLITCKTKALLFELIDKTIKARYDSNLPEIYSTPLVHMDWEQTNRWTQRIRSI